MSLRNLWFSGRNGPMSADWRAALRDLERRIGDAWDRAQSELAAIVADRDTYPPVLVATTGYEFTNEDAGKTIVSSSGSATTFRIPTGLTVPNGARFRVYQQGAGTLTIAGATGVTLRAVSTTAMAGQYGWGEIVRISAHEWAAHGDFA